MSASRPCLNFYDAMLSHYQQVYQSSMADLPISNPNLRVTVMNWQSHPSLGELAVLVTPWCMNLVWRPEGSRKDTSTGKQVDCANQTLSQQKVGTTKTLTLPSGQYDFLVNHNPLTGTFLSCALHSDMWVFDGQNTAVAVAQTVLDLLFDANNQSQDGAKQAEIRQRREAHLFDNDPEALPFATRQRHHQQRVEALAEKEQAAKQQAEQQMNKTVSRRALFGLREEVEPSNTTKTAKVVPLPKDASPSHSYGHD